MKTKFFILTLTLMFIGVLIPSGSLLTADDTFSNKLPSAKYYEQEKGYLNSTSSMTRYASVSMMAKSGGGDWEDEETIGSGTNPPGGGESGGGFVGAPVGDVTPSVILLMLVIYMLFRRTTTSRRKNL